MAGMHRLPAHHQLAVSLQKTFHLPRRVPHNVRVGRLSSYPVIVQPSHTHRAHMLEHAHLNSPRPAQIAPLQRLTQTRTRHPLPGKHHLPPLPLIHRQIPQAVLALAALAVLALVVLVVTLLPLPPLVVVKVKQPAQQAAQQAPETVVVPLRAAVLGSQLALPLAAAPDNQSVQPRAAALDNPSVQERLELRQAMQSRSAAARAFLPVPSP